MALPACIPTIHVLRYTAYCIPNVLELSSTFTTEWATTVLSTGHFYRACRFFGLLYRLCGMYYYYYYCYPHMNDANGFYSNTLIYDRQCSNRYLQHYCPRSIDGQSGSECHRIGKRQCCLPPQSQSQLSSNFSNMSVNVVWELAPCQPLP